MTIELAEGLRRVRQIGARQDWLAVLVTTGVTGEPAVSLVNAAVIDHPVSGAPTLALVSRGDTAKLRNLRARPRATLVFRDGWDWIAVRGSAQLAGPDDTLPGLAPELLPGLLRAIYAAAGGSHPDLDEYDREMVADRRAAVFVEPERFSSNPTPHDREDE
ncbi:pyridoxamine 5'-phosphate oxidase family protein [Actinoplanes regularis]|uniref:pyridoxamine 5'-phosphate oxidase family protein n=1 Tax=Actinoplanes regularis TaxID=52697 RepID=UPI0024A0EC82|nr:pyridoxamine 5'-phosphate oxidase family protein [Actinoplanes regularis]GLW30925.1 PPOX class F420-dependent enzyme [Actinoplanes regularis]